MVRSSPYEWMVAPYLDELYRYCVYISGSFWDGEDLYQETLLKTFRYYKFAGEIKDVRPFLYRVARNLRIDEYRTCRGKQVVELTEAVKINDVSYSEVRGIVEWLASRLTERHIEVWLLAEYFHFTMNEIAERLHMTMSAVRSVLHRARHKLRDCRIHAMDEEGPRGKKTRHSKSVEQQIEHWVRCIMRDDPSVRCKVEHGSLTRSLL